MKFIYLLDLSSKLCEDANFDLGLLYTFLKGDTWYGKWGFRPANKDTNDIDTKKNKIYEKNKYIISKIKVKYCVTLKNTL